MPACVVIYCGSRTERGIRLFSLPQGERNEERRNTWIKNINRQDLPSNIFVCEKHFEDDQFENNRKDGRRPLKYNAIPTIFENNGFKSEVNPGTLPLQRPRRSLRILKPKTYDSFVREVDDDDDVKEEKCKKEIKIYSKKIRCRACLAIIEIANGHILKKQLLGESIKDRILMFIPTLTTILDTEYICDKCCRLVTNFLKFYESCLDTEMKLKTGKISLIIDEKGKEESHTNSIKTVSLPQKVGRKRKQDLLSIREDETGEVHDIIGEINQEVVVSKKRKNPKKDHYSKDGVIKNVDNNGKVNSSKDATTDQGKETTLDVQKEISTKDKKEDVTTDEKENADHKKCNQKESEGNKSCDNQAISANVSDHDYIHIVSHCPECQTDYRTLKGFRNHLIHLHNIVEEHEFICKQCNMKFIRYKDMLKHKNIHGSPCDLCDKIFSSAEELKCHKNTHPDSYHCMRCTNIFKNEELLKKHILLHDAMTKVLLAIKKSALDNRCRSCKYVFLTKQRLRDHIKTVHLKIRDINCPKCERKFSTKSMVSNHLRIKHSSIKPHKCDFCDAAFKRSDHLAAHKLTHKFSNPNRRTYGRAKDDTGKLYQCPFCFTTSSTKQLLITHLSNHANERKFECRYCGLKLSSEITQSIHEKTHEADTTNQFVCVTCWKKFSSEEELQTHELIHFPKLKWFSCCLCGAKFSRKNMLENHLLDLHTKNPDVMNGNLEESIQIVQLNNKDGEVDDGREEGEIIVEDSEDEENVKNKEINSVSLDEEDRNNEDCSMEENINKATFIILDV